MDLGLKGKKVILTGGSRGIGRAALEIFADEGCDIGFFSRRQEQVDETVACLSTRGGTVIGDTFDLENLDDYPAWLTRTADALGGCDIFVPGASSSGAQLNQDWRKSFEYDMLGVVRGCEALEPYLARSDAGAVVMMSSTAAVETFLMPQAFNAMKAAVLTYAGQLSQAWGPKGIRVNAISPGPITFPTGNWEGARVHAPELYEATRQQFALGRFGEPDDVARTLVFLASPASGYTTGTNIVIDGGYTKRIQF